MEDNYFGNVNKSILPPNAAALLYLDCSISSDAQGSDYQEVIYSFPNNLSSASLVIGLRGAFISLVKLSKDTLSYACKENNSNGVEKSEEQIKKTQEFHFIKYRSPNHETLSAGATIDSLGNLTVLILPSLLFDSSIHHFKEILLSLMGYINFLYNDMLTATRSNSKTLTEFLSIFFYNYQAWIHFMKPPENMSITCANHMQLEKIVSTLESASTVFDYPAKNAKMKCRPAQIRGCALFSGNKVLVNHLPFSCLIKVNQYLIMSKSSGCQNYIESKLVVQWLPVNIVCNNKMLRGHHSILMLQKHNLSLAILLYSNDKLSEPPFDCINLGKLCLDEAIELNKKFTFIPDFQLARPELFLDSGKSTVKEKEESGKYFQWFKTQMSPKSLRKASQSFGSSSSLNNLEDCNSLNPGNLSSEQRQSVLTETTNSLFSYSYSDNFRSYSQFLSDYVTKSDPQYHNVIRTLDKMFLKFSKMNFWPGNFVVMESKLSFICRFNLKSTNDSSSKSKLQELKFTIASRREKNGSQLLICYHSNIPQNLKLLLGRVYRKVHFYETCL